MSVQRSLLECTHMNRTQMFVLIMMLGSEALYAANSSELFLMKKKGGLTSREGDKWARGTGSTSSDVYLSAASCLHVSGETTLKQIETRHLM